MTDPLAALEERGWQALSSSGDRAAAFYDDVLGDEVLMLLPGGLVLADRPAALAAMSGAPWSSYRLEDVRVSHPTADTGLVTYGVFARREGQPEYSALISSLYVRHGDDWRLTFHQQTPR